MTTSTPRPPAPSTPSSRAWARTSSPSCIPGADHAFFNEDRPEAYNAASAELLWDRTVGVPAADARLEVREAPVADTGLVGAVPDPRAAPRPSHRRHGRRLLRSARSAGAGRRGTDAPPDQLVAEARPWWHPSMPANRSTRLSPARTADAGADPARRHWLRTRWSGCRPPCAKLAGEQIGYADEVEACYGVRPTRVDEEVLAEAHRRLEEVLPGSRPAGRAAGGLARVPRRPRRPLATGDRTRWPRTCGPGPPALFGLPEGEHVEFELVTDQPWSGFNYYLGGLRSRVAINTDLPGAVDRTGPSGGPRGLSRPPHRAHPQGGRSRPSPSVVGGVDLPGGHPAVPVGRGPGRPGARGGHGPPPRSRSWPATCAPLGIRYDAEVVAAVAEAGEALGAVRSNAAFRLHEDGADPDDGHRRGGPVGIDAPRTGRPRRSSSWSIPTWRAYLTCYVEGLPLCRAFVGGDPTRFDRLLSEQLTPDDLAEQIRDAKAGAAVG